MLNRVIDIGIKKPANHYWMRVLADFMLLNIGAI